MTLSMQSLKLRSVFTALAGAVLAACGGGSTVANSPVSMDGARAMSTSSSAATATYIPQSRGTASTTNSSTTAGTVTSIRFESTSSAEQTNVPVTFAHVFAPGHLAATASLVGRLDSGAIVPLQVNVKALHPDGSVRHAVISGVLPVLGAGEVRTMTLDRSVAATNPAGNVASLLGAGFTTSFNATVNGVRYTASADELMKAAAPKSWLNGSTVNEWQVSAPLKNSAGVAHPHLTARFSVRWYEAVKKARVDVVIENNWAYEAAPQNFTYDAEILVGGKPAYAKPAFEHYHHARWRKLFWWNGTAPEVMIKHNTGYLIASRALPNYNQTLSIPESVLVDLKTRFTANSEPMATGLAVPYMPTTGGRDDIGMLPQWAVVYLLSMDRRARDATLGTAELAGSYSAHYRDKNTDQPVSLIDYPYMTLVGTPGDATNPVTKKVETFPKCATTTACKSPYVDDISHQPAFAYLPYMLTGDHFFLEELQFWGTYNVFNSNPGYRDNIKGLLKPEQVRGQAWALRTLAEVAYITPDNDRLKEHFNRILDSNLDWYNNEYPNNPNANKLGIIVNGYALGYSNNRGMAPWMDDFFTAAVGHVHDLGFTKATSLLKWKANFPIQRMVGAGTCYIRGAMYSMIVRDSETSPFYTTIGQAFKASDDLELGSTFSSLQCGSAAMATALNLKVGEMTGYSGAYAGYPSNMQPALAYAADVGGADGAKAWQVFMSRSVKPDYRFGPQFDIVPR
ncbi:conserved exported hypothetical protein [Massilia sp. 9I]|nr:conserved exported hypothetical protein [Massilia sp. 9I]